MATSGFIQDYIIYQNILNRELILATITDPVIDQWYKDVKNNLVFKVAVIKESDGSIEMQYHNGNIGEFDNGIWYNSNFDFIEPSEDWNASFYNLDLDDLGCSNSDTQRSNMNDTPLKDFLD